MGLTMVNDCTAPGNENLKLKMVKPSVSLSERLSPPADQQGTWAGRPPRILLELDCGSLHGEKRTNENLLLAVLDSKPGPICLGARAGQKGRWQGGFLGVLRRKRCENVNALRLSCE